MAKKNIMQIIFIVVLVIVLCIIVRLFIDEKNTISTETNNNSMFSQSGGTFFNKPNGDMSQPGVGNNANVSHTGATEISRIQQIICKRILLQKVHKTHC